MELVNISIMNELESGTKLPTSGACVEVELVGGAEVEFVGVGFVLVLLLDCASATPIAVKDKLANSKIRTTDFLEKNKLLLAIANTHNLYGLCLYSSIKRSHRS